MNHVFFDSSYNMIVISIDKRVFFFFFSIFRTLQYHNSSSYKILSPICQYRSGSQVSKQVHATHTVLAAWQLSHSWRYCSPQTNVVMANHHVCADKYYQNGWLSTAMLVLLEGNIIHWSRWQKDCWFQHWVSSFLFVSLVLLTSR